MQQDARRYLIALAVLLVGTGLTQAARALRATEAHYEADFSAVPLTIGEYRGKRTPVDESIFAYLQANAMEERVYTGRDRWVRLALIYGTDWRSIHAPTGCFPAQGWQIVHNRVLELEAPPGCPHPGPLEVRVVDVTKADHRQLAMFAYARPGATTADWTVHGWKVATGPRGAGGMIIILQTDVGAGDPAQAEATLRQFMAAVYPKAVGLWYLGQTTKTAGRPAGAGGQESEGSP